MSKHRLLLASQSPRRRQLLALLGLPFEMVVPNVAEVSWANEPPAALVVRLSQAKARDACSEMSAQPPPGFDATIVIACDTVVALDGELLGKPCDVTEATAMLRRLRKRSHTVYSAVTLLGTVTGRALTDIVETRVTMRAYTDAEIGAYVASGDPLDKAGAYAIQHSGFHPVAELQGCYANVVGLPLCHLTRGLRAWGIKQIQDVAAACQAHTGRHCVVHATILNDK